MISIVFSPKWFYTYDFIFDALAVLIALFIAGYSAKLFKYSKERNHLYFGLSFLAITAGFLAKIATNFTVYFTKEISKNIGEVIVKYTMHTPSSVFFNLGFFFYRLFFLLGFLGLFLILLRHKEEKCVFSMLLYFVFITTVFSWSKYFVFHFTSVLFLLFIFYSYFKIFKINRNLKTMLIALSFMLILISQVLFFFVFVSRTFYAIAEVVQLLGFLIIAFSFFTITYRKPKKGKWQKKERRLK